jgi:hypothetical protein
MSLRKKGRNNQSASGNTFPRVQDVSGGMSAHQFSSAVANALHRSYGGSHAAVKTVVAQTGANPRAVRNWFEGKNGPSGQHLVDLMRHSDEVLEALLILSGRERILRAKWVLNVRDRLVELLELLRGLERADR